MFRVRLATAARTLRPPAQRLPLAAAITDAAIRTKSFLIAESFGELVEVHCGSLLCDVWEDAIDEGAINGPVFALLLDAQFDDWCAMKNGMPLSEFIESDLLLFQ